MNLMYIIRETALMMGFTFVVGIAFAYVLKGMTFFFSRFGGWPFRLDGPEPGMGPGLPHEPDTYLPQYLVVGL